MKRKTTKPGIKIKQYVGALRTKLKSLPKWTKIGVAGVVLMYAGIAGLTSAAIPWWIGKGDSALHIDYALSVYQGDIPKYHDFVQYPIFHQLDKGYKTQFQRAAANPPLFYVMHAPIVGPLLEAGRWKPAIALGRAFNVFLGVLTVLALAWAGWLFGGRRKELFAVAVPAVASLSFHFTNLNQNYALDVFLVLLGVLTTILWYKLLQQGFRKPLVFSLFLLSVLGMATKASYIIFLAISLLTVMIVALIYSKGSRLKKLFSGSVISALVLLAVLISIGWFYYYWNYKTSGNWFDAELPTDFKSRPRKTLRMVITHPGLWASFYKRFTSYENLSIFLTLSSLIGIAVLGVRTRFKGILKDRTMLISTGLLAILLAGTFATQVAHAVGVGNFSFRYFLPALLVFSLFISYGLLEIRQFRGQLLSLALGAMTVTSIITIAKLENIEAWVPQVGLTNNIFQKLHLALVSNGFPGVVTWFIFLVIAAGMGALTVALFKLTKPVKN